jgi:uncharacterized membrane protein
MADETGTAAGGAIAPGDGALEPRVLAVGRGAAWWGEGWRLFTPNVGAWLLIAVIMILIECGLSLVGSLLLIIPLIGQLISTFLFAAAAVLFGAGLMIGCRSVDRGNPLVVGHLFAGFSQRTKPLLMVALIYSGLLIVVGVLVLVTMVAIFGVAIIGALTSAADPSNMTGALGTMVSALLVAVLLFMLLFLPVLMAVWFAPALVMLGDIDPWPAMVMSFRGCLKNFAPFLVYGAIGLGLAIVASIPLLLGWLVLYPVTMATVYASYCDIFEDKDLV